MRFIKIHVNRTNLLSSCRSHGKGRKHDGQHMVRFSGHYGTFCDPRNCHWWGRSFVRSGPCIFVWWKMFIAKNLIKNSTLSDRTLQTRVLLHWLPFHRENPRWWFLSEGPAQTSRVSNWPDFGWLSIHPALMLLHPEIFRMLLCEADISTNPREWSAGMALCWLNNIYRRNSRTTVCTLRFQCFQTCIGQLRSNFLRTCP